VVNFPALKITQIVSP